MKFAELKSEIINKIRTNGKQEITGAVLQQQLLKIVDTIEKSYNKLTEDISENESHVEETLSLLTQSLTAEIEDIIKVVSEEVKDRETADQTLYDDLQNKVDKVEGKNLSSNDYTDAEKRKLASLQNYDDTDVFNLLGSKLDKVEAETRFSEKQDTIKDLVQIREGAQKGATALQSVPSGYVKESSLISELAKKQDVINDLHTIRYGASQGEAAMQAVPSLSAAIQQKVDAVKGKGLSTNDYTNEEKSKLALLQDREIILTTWAELKSLRDTNQLKAGMLYRITDYVTTTSQEDTRSAGHQFDVIVLALTQKTLSEEAYAAIHEGDTYFTEAGANLAVWKLWYCLDNDLSRFLWADSDNGKGVVYRIIDEWGNDCPYDFKNILFRVGIYEDGSIAKEGDEDFSVYCYTFTYKYENRSVIDASIYGNNGLLQNDAGEVDGVRDNSMKVAYDGQEINGYYFYQIARLNRNVFYAREESDGGPFYGFNQNLFGIGCFENIIQDGSIGNNFGISCFRNQLGVGCTWNTFLDGCSRNLIGGGGTSNNKFGQGCIGNIMGEYCSFNKLGSDCTENKFGDSCKGNVFGNFCRKNKFARNFSQNILGNNCSYNETENDDDANFEYNVFEENVNGITMILGQGTGSSQNYRVCSGVYGQDIGFSRGRSYQTHVMVKPDGNLSIRCLAETL